MKKPAGVGICTEAYKLGSGRELGYHGQVAGGWETRGNGGLAVVEFVLGQEVRQHGTRSLGTPEASQAQCLAFIWTPLCGGERAAESPSFVST